MWIFSFIKYNKKTYLKLTESPSLMYKDDFIWFIIQIESHFSPDQLCIRPLQQSNFIKSLSDILVMHIIHWTIRGTSIDLWSLKENLNYEVKWRIIFSSLLKTERLLKKFYRTVQTDQSIATLCFRE